MKKHPGTSGLMPVKGSGCGIRPDPDAFPEDTGFDFSEAQKLLKTADSGNSGTTPEKGQETPGTPS